MDILIICKSFYPQISPRSFRATELAKELARQGNKVTVIFPNQGLNYEKFERDHNVDIVDLGSLHFREVTIHGGKLETFLRRIFKRVMNLFLEYPDIELVFKIRKRLTKYKKFDLLISIAVPHPIHWGIALIWGKNRIATKWIADCGDPYMLARMDRFNKPFYFKYFEKKFCREADFITVPFDGARNAYYSEFRNKIRIIPQGVDLNIFKPKAVSKSSDYPIFAYVGNFIPGKRDPRKFLEYLSLVETDFRFIVFTSQPDILVPYVQKLNGKLNIMEFVNREDLIEKLCEMSFLVNLDNNDPTVLPSKLIDYAITGRPVLNIKKELDSTIVDEFLSGNYSRKMILPDPVKYDIRIVARSFLEL